MKSADIRQSFLDFFKEKGHTIVSSASLLPEAPNLLFTNAGMNQFVPIFTGNAPCSYAPPRAADTQKCIRAGGKHNDLEDVGYDTYHHTFFEMLGNWSFGDYFKKEAIEWAWELVVERWGFPPERLYATVYKPDKGDPAEFDQEAYDFWAAIFKKAGLDPKVHIVYGNKKDNFWMMGDTGPCGPCSELHVNLKSTVDTKADRKIVNADDPRCIEIWNLVFIQFNADGKGGYPPLPAQHVDTGMGFERVASIIQGTSGFTKFDGAKISNYNTDVFRPLFDSIEELSGKKYNSTLPGPGAKKFTEQEKTDIAMRVIADHVRTLSFSIADGIIPSNADRGYVLRRILRRAVRYGRDLGLHEPFLFRLVSTLTKHMGDVFPEIVQQRKKIEKTITSEEESFLKTLDRGIDLFNKEADALGETKAFPGHVAFKLYDTYGFPLDLTDLMARERGLAVDHGTFDELMAAQKKQAQAAQKKDAIEVSGAASDADPTTFIGYDTLEAKVEVLSVEDGVLVVKETPFYAAMGGQVSDHGEAVAGKKKIPISDVQKSPEGVVVHQLKGDTSALKPGEKIELHVDPTRRGRIESHHSATHIMHWALRKILGDHVAQKGSYVGPERLRFDFSHHCAMTPEEIREVEKLVNAHIDRAERVVWKERPYAEVKGDPNILQFFGDKYGETVRVVSIADYSHELCGGTHVRETGEIGFFKVLSESAIAAGVRRIEATCGSALIDYVRGELLKQNERHSTLTRRKINVAALKHIDDAAAPSKVWEDFSARQLQLEEIEADIREWEKQEAKNRQAQWQQTAVKQSKNLIKGAKTIKGIQLITEEVLGEDPGYLRVLGDALKAEGFEGVAVFGAGGQGKAILLALVSPRLTKQVRAGDIIKEIAPLVGGKGGGKPEMAQGGGNDPNKIQEALAKVKDLL